MTRLRNKEQNKKDSKKHYAKYGDVVRAKAKEYHWKNREKRIEASKKYYHTHREEMLKKNAEYKKEHKEQYRIWGNESRTRKLETIAGRLKPEVCEVCGNAEARIVFDHDHITGKFRGWICDNCNVVLGHSKDNVEVLYKLINYLNQSRGLIVINQEQLLPSNTQPNI